MLRCTEEVFNIVFYSVPQLYCLLKSVTSRTSHTLNESCRTYEWVTSRVWWLDAREKYLILNSIVYLSFTAPSYQLRLGRVTLWMSRESRRTYEWVTLHTMIGGTEELYNIVFYIILYSILYLSFTACSNQLRLERVTLWMSRVARMNGSRHTYDD